MNNEIREKQISKASIIGIITNFILVVFKMIVGLIGKAIPIVLDAINNLTDIISSLVTLIGIKLAKKKPDKNHPFGHGRIEYISAIIVAIIVLAAGVGSFIKSINNIFKPNIPDYSYLSIIVIVVAIVTKIILGNYIKKQGLKYQSNALVGSGEDAKYDALITTSTLIGALSFKFFSFNIDAYLGILISLFIFKTGFSMLLESLNSIIGMRFDEGVGDEIMEYICTYPGIKNAYDLLVHNYGPLYAIGSLHIEVDGDMKAYDLSILTHRIQEDVKNKYNIVLNIAVYATNKENETICKQIKEISKKYEGILECHNIYIDNKNKNISFDLVVNYLAKQDEIKENIIKDIKELIKDYDIDIEFDLYYSKLDENIKHH